MTRFRKLLLAASVAAIPFAVTAGAKAASPRDPGIVLYNAAGVPVAILTPIQAGSRAVDVATQQQDPATRMLREIAAATSADDDDGMFPFAQIMAQQDRMMHEVMAQMRGLMSGAGPFSRAGTTEAALPAAPGAEQVMISSFTSGRGTCGQTVTYEFTGNGAQPRVSVRQVGDACGAAGLPATRSIPAAIERRAPEPATPAVPTVSPDTRTYRIDYRTPAHKVAPMDLRG